MIRLAHCENATTPGDIETFSRRAAAAGLQGISLHVNDGFFRELNEADAAAISRLEAVRSVSIEWVDPLPDYQAERESATQFRKQVAKWLQQTASLGARTLELFTQSDSSNSSCDLLPILVDHLLALRFDAQRCAVSLAFRLSHGATPLSDSDAFAALDRVNSPWVGLAVHLQEANNAASIKHAIARLCHRVALIRLEASVTKRIQESVCDALRRLRVNIPIVCPLESFPA